MIAAIKLNKCTFYIKIRFEGLINIVMILYDSFVSVYRYKVRLIIAFKFGSPRQVLVGSSCKPFKYDFNVFWDVTISVSIKVYDIIKLYSFSL